MNAATLLTQARHAGQLTQAALARAAGMPQPSIARTERARRDLHVSTLGRLVHAAGCQLAVLPSTRATAAGTADAVRHAIDRHDEDTAYRIVIQLADDLARETGAERVALCVTPPPPTGDVRFDAFIAGVVEHRLGQSRLPIPKWLANAARLSVDWHVDPSTANHETAAATPRALLKRGVIIADVELASA